MAKTGQGQTLNDRLNAARYALAGQGLARVVCKATTEEIIGPKKKHLDYLLQCTHEPNVSIPQLANLLIERTNHSSWVVVFKALITVHYLMCYGNERFTQYLASNHCTFQLNNFLDRSSLNGYDMSSYIKSYSEYINEKALSYRTVAFDFAKIKRGKEDGFLRTLPSEKLLKTLAVLQSKIDGILEFDCPTNNLTNGVINAAFMLLFRDLIRLFACYNDGIINLLEKFLDMNKEQCRDALQIYQKFLIRMDRVAEFLKVAENVGIDKGEIPDLTRAPSTLLGALEQHLQTLEGDKKVKSTKDALSSSQGVSNTSTPLSTVEPPSEGVKDDLVKKALEEEVQMLNQLKINKKQQSNQYDLSDESKILDQVTLLNKDTGECRSLSQADDILPKCINPLNPHLSKLANDYQSDEDETQPQASDEATTLEEGDEPGTTMKPNAFKQGVKKLGKFGHGFIKGVKNVRGGAGATGTGFGNEGSVAVASGTTTTTSSSDTKFYRDSVTIDPRILNLDPHDLLFPMFKLKTNRKKDAADFEGLRLIQELNDCRGAVWCMKWSSCGQLLAVAGQDQLLRVYCSHKSWKHFTQARSKASSQQISPNSTKEKSVNNSRNNSISSSENVHSLSDSRSRNNLQEDSNSLAEEDPLLLFSVYRGHTADVLDISWSKNNFLLSSSMDKTVKLWHITRVECLCTFCHKDFVSTINFHPRDDRYFLSGSLDGVLRLWNIPDKRLTLFNEVMAPTAASQKSSNKSNQETTPSHGLITASAFVENGKFAVIGTYDGRVIFYSTDQLKYSTQIHVSGGKNVSSVTDTERKKKRNSNKVTGIEGVAERKILVTTNDSRIRLYDLRDLTLECKYKGCVNYSSQIRASVSPDNKYIVCGSENSSFYIWRTREETTTGQRRDRNAQWECVRLLPPSPQVGLNNVGPGQPSKNQPAIVTSATFAPIPSYLDDKAKYIIAVADFSGSIKVLAR